MGFVQFFLQVIDKVHKRCWLRSLVCFISEVQQALQALHQQPFPSARLSARKLPYPPCTRPMRRAHFWRTPCPQAVILAGDANSLPTRYSYYADSPTPAVAMAQIVSLKSSLIKKREINQVVFLQERHKTIQNFLRSLLDVAFQKIGMPCCEFK